MGRNSSSSEPMDGKIHKALQDFYLWMWGLCSLLWLDQDYCFIIEGGDIRWQSECGLELNFKST